MNTTTYEERLAQQQEFEHERAFWRKNINWIFQGLLWVFLATTVVLCGMTWVGYKLLG